MADSVDAKGVTSEWTDLNTLFGIPSGTEVLLQVVIGYNQDLLELWIGPTKPTTERGEVIKQYDPPYRVNAGESIIWGRYFVPSRDVNQYTPNKTTRVSMREVVSQGDITEEVSLGNVPGRTAFSKFGRTTNIDSNQPTTIWDGANTPYIDRIYVPPTAAQIHTVTSDDGSDNETGTGARTIRIYGLDVNNDPITDDVIMDGTNDVDTIVEFSYIYRAKVLTSGTQNVNDGDITITASIDGTISAVITEEAGQTLMCVYRVPRNKKLLIRSYHASLGRNNPSNARCNIEMIAIENATTNPTINLKHSVGVSVNSGVAGETRAYPWVFEALTDMNLRAMDCSDNNTEVTAWWDGVLRDD
ncbi:MAG: hypothetical protein GY861_04020 [bacterium]|nr:hypothetical protein [bacterium]